jgi:hypothetical protein
MWIGQTGAASASAHMHNLPTQADEEMGMTVWDEVRRQIETLTADIRSMRRSR